MLSCLELTELVDYVERRMSFGQRLRFQLHLGLCRHCREYLRQVQRAIRVTRALRPEDVPPEVRAELLRHFRRWCARKPAGLTFGRRGLTA